ncbi:MAG: leucine-rich repeat domain-containing protein [Candidatus Accumulibacter sp.]|jgi:Leucine-rich repeat (LRR) protein|nr:leucine-rich repeat domain-containing protein [Accumulibacter sp.]
MIKALEVLALFLVILIARKILPFIALAMLALIIPSKWLKPKEEINQAEEEEEEEEGDDDGEEDALWVEKLWQWAAENKIKKDHLPHDKAKLLATETLDLWIPGFSKLPKEIRYLSKLKKLRLRSGFVSLTRQIGHLTNLTVLDVSESYLDKLPEEIGALVNLTTLNVYDTRMTELPKSIGALKNLQQLNIGLTYIKTLPQEICALENLRQIEFYGEYSERGEEPRQIREIPEQVYALTSLRVLSSRFNPVKSLSPKIGNLKNLRRLELHDNYFTEIPGEIGALKELRVLDLGGYNSNLTAIPKEIGALQALEELDIECGTLLLPPELWTLTRLKKLRLWWRYDAPVKYFPKEIAALTQLEDININGKGEIKIPQEFWSLKKIKRMQNMDLNDWKTSRSRHDIFNA